MRKPSTTTGGVESHAVKVARGVPPTRPRAAETMQPPRLYAPAGRISSGPSRHLPARASSPAGPSSTDYARRTDAVQLICPRSAAAGRNSSCGSSSSSEEGGAAPKAPLAAASAPRGRRGAPRKSGSSGRAFRWRRGTAVAAREPAAPVPDTTTHERSAAAASPPDATTHESRRVAAAHALRLPEPPAERRALCRSISRAAATASAAGQEKRRRAPTYAGVSVLTRALSLPRHLRRRSAPSHVGALSTAWRRLPMLVLAQCIMAAAENAAGPRSAAAASRSDARLSALENVPPNKKFRRLQATPGGLLNRPRRPQRRRSSRSCPARRRSPRPPRGTDNE